MRPSKFLIWAACFSVLAAAPGESQTLVNANLTYADLADLAIPAPIAAHVEVREAIRLKGEDAAGVDPGKTRFYVEADLVSLIRGPTGFPATARYLVDLPNDARGRPPKLRKKSQLILLAAPVAGRAGEVRLVAPDAQLPYSDDLAARLRSLLQEAVRADAPPRITGIGRAFHVPGTLPGESETQIFLQTEDNRPVSLTILRRPGETPRWAAALSEIVDNAAAPPQPDTLLWYRLACTLPGDLPALSIADAEPREADAIRADYRLVIERLGPCTRTRAQN